MHIPLTQIIQKSKSKSSRKSTPQETPFKDKDQYEETIISSSDDSVETEKVPSATLNSSRRPTIVNLKLID